MRIHFVLMWMMRADVIDRFTFSEGSAFAVVMQRPLVVPDLLVEISDLDDRND